MKVWEKESVMQDVVRTVDTSTKKTVESVQDGIARGARPLNKDGRQLTKREANRLPGVYNGQ